MNDLSSLPASLRQHFEQLEKADTLVQQNRGSEASDVLRQAGLELARSQPELFAVMMLASMGYRGITYTQSEFGPKYSGMGRLFASMLGDNPDAEVLVRRTKRTIELIGQQNGLPVVADRETTWPPPSRRP